jgi:hypothetical protein
MGGSSWEGGLGGEEGHHAGEDQKADNIVSHSFVHAIYIILGYYLCEYGEDTSDGKVRGSTPLGRLTVLTIRQMAINSPLAGGGGRDCKSIGRTRVVSNCGPNPIPRWSTKDSPAHRLEV